MFGSLGVQVVTYHNEPAQLTRLAEGLAATLSAARAAFPDLSRIAVRFGDCGTPASLPSVADDLRERLDDVADDVDILLFHDNLGSGGGSNALAAGRDEELIWVLNPDTYPSPRCATELVRALADESAERAVGAVDGRQIPLEHPKAYDPITGDTSWASGSCLMVRRDAFESVGGFDAEFFPMYCDDVDLSWRLQLSGWRVVHAPRAAVFHDKRIDSRGSVEASDFERASSALARLWLTRKFGRPDLEAGALAGFASSDHLALREAAASFTQRVEAGDVPAMLDHPERVAQFIDGEYAVHRFRHDVVPG